MLHMRLFLIFVLSCLLWACKDSTESAIPAAIPLAPAALSLHPGGRPRIALVLKTLTNPFFVEMESGARRAEKEFGIDLQVKTGSQETAIEQQIQIVDDLIESKVSAIVIAPGDSARLVPILKKAQNAGIVIINIDNHLDAGAMTGQRMKPVPFVSVDNEAASYQSAKYIADQVHKPTKAGILEGIRSAENAQLRMTGARRAFGENNNIKLVASETANWQIDEARDAAKRMFSVHPDIGLLFCANDMMAIGALKYLQENGRKDVLVAGYDAISEAKAAVKAGAMAATIDQQAEQQGYLGVVLAIRALHGEALPATTMVPVRLVTAHTL